MRLHHAVQHGLHRARGNPVVPIRAARLLGFLDRGRRQLRRIQAVRDVLAHGEFAIVAQFVVQIQPFEIAARAVYAHQAHAVGFVQSFAQGRQALVARGLGRELRDQPAGCLQQRASGLALFVAHDLSIGRIGRLARDACHGQRLAVRP